MRSNPASVSRAVSRASAIARMVAGSLTSTGPEAASEAATLSEISADQRSITSVTSADLSGKYWYSEPGLTSASSATRLVVNDS